MGLWIIIRLASFYNNLLGMVQISFGIHVRGAARVIRVKSSSALKCDFGHVEGFLRWNARTARARVDKTPFLLAPFWCVFPLALWVPVRIPSFALATSRSRVVDGFSVDGHLRCANSVSEANATATSLTDVNDLRGPQVF
jgi:hypothetical protein